MRARASERLQTNFSNSSTHIVLCVCFDNVSYNVHIYAVTVAASVCFNILCIKYILYARASFIPLARLCAPSRMCLCQCMYIYLCTCCSCVHIDESFPHSNSNIIHKHNNNEIIPCVYMEMKMMICCCCCSCCCSSTAMLYFISIHRQNIGRTRRLHIRRQRRAVSINAEGEW